MEQKLIKEKIKFFRQQNKLTQHSMAIIMGITQSYYQKIESGESYIQLLDFIKICNIFNISLDSLLSFDIKTHQKLTDINLSPVEETETPVEDVEKSSKEEKDHAALLQIYKNVKEQEIIIKTLIANSKSLNNNDKFLRE
jgi:transcriptional regulator with XRE-family HTH domain